MGRWNYRKIDSISSLFLGAHCYHICMYCPTIEYIRPRGHPFESISLLSHPPQLSMFPTLESSLVIRHIKHSRQDVGCYVSLSGPNMYIIVHSFSCALHEPSRYSRQHRPTPKNTLRGNLGCAVGPKTPTAWVATLVAEAMAIVRAPGEAVVTCGHEVSHGIGITESGEIPTEVGVVVFLGTRGSGG
jgi:hypothetical protein